MDTERVGWTGYDRAAGVVSLALMAGYFVDPIQAAVVAALSVALEPLAVAVPFSVLVVLLAGTNGVYTAILQVKLRNQDRIDDLQDRMKTLRERLEEANGEQADLADHQRELARTWTALMKSSLRPMAWSMLVTVPAFLWLRWVFVAAAPGLAPAAVFIPLLGHTPWTATLVGPIKLWLVWYVGASLSTGYVARKAVGRVAGA